MKKLVMLAAVVKLAIVSANAFTISTNLPANRTLNFLTNYAQITSITVDNTNATTIARVYFYASPSTNTHYTLNEYSNIVRTVGTLTNIYTNVLGTIQTNTYPGIRISTNVVAASTNLYPLIYTANVNSNSVSTYEPSLPISTVGLTITNSAAVNITIQYEQ